jgi:undecaprenyl-diphosphatase
MTTTFQAIIYGILHGFTEFLPVSSSAHHILVPYLVGWPEPGAALMGALSLGAMLALLVFFRHDWASIISTFLAVLIYRKKPMTLDERMPIFMAITAAPTAIAWYYFHDQATEAISSSPLLVAGTLAAFSLPLAVTESMSRKNKNMFDWNGVDALSIGITQLFMILPGCGRMAAQLPGAFIRNYSRLAAVKYCLFASLPILIATTVHYLRPIDFHAQSPGDVTWLSFIVATVVSMFASLLSIGGIMGQVQRGGKGLGGYVVYRLLLAGAVAGVFWMRSRG